MAGNCLVKTFLRLLCSLGTGENKNTLNTVLPVKRQRQSRNDSRENGCMFPSSLKPVMQNSDESAEQTRAIYRNQM